MIHGDLGDVNVLNAAFDTSPKLDKVIHFAAVAHVGESMADPNKYYKSGRKQRPRCYKRWIDLM